MTTKAADQLVTEVRTALQVSTTFLEQALIRIYQEQTLSEQSRGETVEHNGVGFSGTDSRYLSYSARWVLSGKPLSGSHITKVTRLMLKYSRQLVELGVTPVTPFRLEQFDWNRQTRILTAEASSLLIPPGEVRKALQIFSQQTGVTANFSLVKVYRNDENEETHWQYETPDLNVKVILLND